MHGRLRQGRGERGAALVEAAIILPLLLLLTFGAIEFGIAFSEKGGLESAARGGARKAATLTNIDGLSGQEIGVETVSAVNAALDSSAVPKLTELEVYRADTGCTPGDCVTFTPDGTFKRFDPLSASGTFPLTLGGVPNRDGCSATPQRVTVKVVGEFDFVTKLVGTSPMTLSATTTLQFEPIGC